MATRYRPRPADPLADEAAAILVRIEARRRRELVPLRMAVPPAARRYVGPALDYAAIPVLWIAAVLLVWPGGQWWIIPAAAAHLAGVYLVLRWPGAGRNRPAAAHPALDAGRWLSARAGGHGETGAALGRPGGRLRGRHGRR